MTSEERLKSEHLKNMAYQAAGQCGRADSPFPDASKLDETKCAQASLRETQPSLRERVYAQRRRAEEQVQRAMALSELEHLLDRNPEVARILDLYEQAKYSL